MIRLRHVLALVAVSVVAALAAVQALAAPGVQPQSVQLQLNPGDSAHVTKQVTTNRLPPASDFVFLADNTGSMGPSIADVKTNAQAIIDAIEAAGATDARYAVANYQDFTQFGPCPYGFQLNTDLTDATAAKAAIGTWAAGDGCDTAESALFAMHRVAVHDISWRTGSERFLIWFGDAPSHDPICSALPGYSDPHPVVTEASATADLVAQGIHVIAASAPSGPGLDADPLLYAVDYGALCGGEAGTAGQAQRITAATDGVDFVNPPATSISQTIIDAINALPPIPVTVTPSATCDPGLTVANSPTSQTVPSGTTATFDETVSVDAFATVGSTLHCTVDFLVNGVSAGPAFEESVTVDVGVSTPGCKVTYGGRIETESGDRATFGGNAMVPTSGAQGEEQYQDHGPATPLNVHSLTAGAVVCTETAATIFGTATVDGAGAFNYRIDLTDAGEPGSNDHYRIRLSNGYDSGDQQLVGGNVQLH